MPAPAVCQPGVASLVDCLMTASMDPDQSDAFNLAWALLKSKGFASPVEFWATLPKARLPLFSRWHLTTQDRLMRQLRSIWSDDVPRTMVDLGCHAGHTWWHNLSDVRRPVSSLQPMSCGPTLPHSD